jgi:hypothetical protein
MGERGPVPSDIYQTSPAHVGPAVFIVGEKFLMLSWAISFQGLVANCGKTLWRLAIVALLQVRAPPIRPTSLATRCQFLRDGHAG